MADNLKKIFQQLKDFDANPKTVKLSLARKREMLFQVLKLSQTLPKPQIVEFVFLLSKFGCGASMVREMVETLKYLYTQGGDFTKVQAEFFDPAVQIINNAKSTGLQKLIFVQLSGKLFKAVWTRCPNPPTKDLYEAYTKLKPNQTEKFLRESAYKALKDIIKCNPSNLFQIQADLLKHLIRASKEEKVPSVKAEILSCLRVLIRDTMNYSTLHANYESIFAAVTKGFEEPDTEVQHGWVKICIALLGARLQESQQQGDIRTGFKAYNQQQRDALSAAKKKPLATLLDVPRTLSDVFSLFSALMLQNGITLSVRQQLAQSLTGLMEVYPTHLEATDPETMLNSLLLTISSKKDIDGFQQRELVLWVLTNAVSLMQLDQRTALLKLAVQSLERKQLLISVGTLQTLQASCAKSQTLSTLINEHHIITLLRVSTAVIFKIDANTFSGIFQQEKDVLNAVNPYLRNPYQQEVRLFGVEFVKAVGFRAPKWIHNLIQLFLSMTSIQHADNQSLAQTTIYGNAIPEKHQLRSELIENYGALKILATALACLITSVKETIKGVPLALVTTALNAAKNQILGNMPLDLPPDQSHRLDLNSIEINNSQRQESGWIILQGLLTLGKDWIDTQISLISKLFKTVFCKSMCVIEPKRIKDHAYQEVLLRELKIKGQALVCIRIYLDEASDDLRQKTNALIGSYLCNALQFLMHPAGDKGNLEKLFMHYLPADLEKARSNLIYCLAKIPPEFTKSSHAQLVKNLQELICENDGQREFSNLATTLLTQQDAHLNEESKAQQIMKSIWQKTSKYLIASLARSPASQITNLENFLLAYEKPYPYCKQVSSNHGLDSSICLFANIFLSDSLDQKIKLQYLGLFQQMVESEIKDRPHRSIFVATTLLQIVKQNNQVTIKSDSVATYNIHHASQQSQSLTSEESSRVLDILNCLSRVDNELLIRLAGETYVHLLAQKIMRQPKVILPQILADLEARLQAKQPDDSADGKIAKKKAAIVCAMLVRLFDSEQVLGEAKDRITGLLVRLLKETEHSIRRFTVHYACEVGIEGLFDGEEDLQSYFNNAFPSLFHLVQTDIQPNFSDFAAVANLINAQLRFFEPDCQRNPPSPLRVFLSSNKRMQTVIHEMIEIFFLSKNSEVATLTQAITMVKTAIMAGLDITESRKQHVVTRLIELLRSRQLPFKLKNLIIEALAVAVIKGYFKDSPKLAAGFQNILIDELNLATLESAQFEGTAIKIDFNGILSGSEQFEAMINGEGTNSAQDSKLPKGLVGTSARCYKRALKILLLMVFQLSQAGEADFRSAFLNLMNLTKSVIMYKHTTLSQQLEQGLKMDQKKAIIDDPSNFFYTKSLTEDVIHFVAKAFKSLVTLFSTVQAGNGESEVFGNSKDTDVRSQVSNLITLAFTIISQDSTRLKQVGLKLVIELVKLFSQACEKVGDDDDEDERKKQKAEKRRIKTFMASPLLLEQYEAQIFSIIRTHLQAADKSKVPPNITAINYDLIYLFVTTPICKDQGSIKKILDMLMEGMDKTQLVGIEMHSFEGAITDAHFKKLMLLAKLLVVSQPNGEAQIERLSQLTRDLDRAHDDRKVEPAQILDAGLPSKFTREDQERLAELLYKPQVLKTLTKHFACALSDALIAQLGRQGNSRKFGFITSVGGQGSAYSPKIVAQSVPYAICALTQIASKDQSFALSDTEALALRASLLHNLNFQPSLQGQSHGKKIDKSDLVRFANHKLCYLKFIEEMLGAAPKLVVQGAAELAELFAILEKLPSLGIAEIDEALIRIVNQTLPLMVKHGLAGKAFDLTSQIVASLLPDIFDQSSVAAGQSDFGGFLSQPKSVQRGDSVGPVLRLSLLTLCSGVFVLWAQHAASKNLMEPLQTLLTYIALNIDKIIDLETRDCLVLTARKIFVAIPQNNDPDVLQPMLTSLGCKMVLQAVAENKFSISSQAIFASLVSATQGDSFQLRSALSVLETSNSNAQVVLSVVHSCLDSSVTELKIEAGVKAFQVAYNQVTQSQDDSLISNCLSEIAKFYASALDSAQRAAVLPIYLSLLFTVIQMKQLQPQTRQKGAEGIFAIFRVDQQAFKNYATPIPGSSHSNLTLPEKTLIENVIKQFAALSMQPQATAASQPTTQSILRPPVKSDQQGTQPLMTPTQASKIKLGFNFKANK